MVAPFQRWESPDGKQGAWFFNVDDFFLVRFENIADFRIDAVTGTTCCIPALDSALAWRAVYEQQIRPLLLSLRGELVFHGAAIAAGDEAIAILGPSGRGKSTLTSAFARRGHPFLGDDCLQLDLTGSQVRVHPQADFVRLWEDSALHIGKGEATYLPGTPKPRLQASEHFPHCARMLPLARIYLLGDGSAEQPTITHVAPNEQLMGWTANAFVLDIKNPDVARRNLTAAARLVREIPMQRLDYPRRYDLLDAVVDRVLADVAAPPGHERG